jgi:hypothetical protein
MFKVNDEDWLIYCKLVHRAYLPKWIIQSNIIYLHKAFALELIESVLTNYHKLLKKASLLVPFSY